MKKIKSGVTGKTIEIGGTDNEEKIVSHDGHLANRFADFSLHKGDLEFSNACLEEINKIPNENDLVRQALWKISIISFFKCFGRNEGRPNSLRADKIFSNKENGVEVFNFFKNLRNKNIAHDENRYSEAKVGIVLNKPREEKKISRIITVNMQASTLDHDHWAQMKNLVETANEFVFKEYNILAEKIGAELKTLSFEELNEKPEIKFKAPFSSEVYRKKDLLK